MIRTLMFIFACAAPLMAEVAHEDLLNASTRRHHHDSSSSSDSSREKKVKCAKNFGEIYVDAANIVFPFNNASGNAVSANTFVPFNPFTNSALLKGVIADVDEGSLTVSNDGVYLVSFNVSLGFVGSSTAAVNLVVISDSGNQYPIAASFTSAATEINNLAASGFIKLEAGDSIYIQIQSSNAGAPLIVPAACFNLVQIQ